MAAVSKVVMRKLPPADFPLRWAFFAPDGTYLSGYLNQANAIKAMERNGWDVVFEKEKAPAR